MPSNTTSAKAVQVGLTRKEADEVVTALKFVAETRKGSGKYAKAGHLDDVIERIEDNR